MSHPTDIFVSFLFWYTRTWREKTRKPSTETIKMPRTITETGRRRRRRRRGSKMRTRTRTRTRTRAGRRTNNKYENKNKNVRGKKNK